MARMIEVVMPGKEKKIIDLDELFDIDETNLTKEYAKQASTYAYYGTLYNIADRSVMEMDAKKDSTYAEIELAYRDELKEDKPTEGRIKSMVLTDEGYAEVLGKYAFAVYRKNTLKTIMDALKMRADMMISMGAHLRAEYDQTGMNMKYDSSVKDLREKLGKSDKAGKPSLV